MGEREVARSEDGRGLCSRGVCAHVGPWGPGGICRWPAAGGCADSQSSTVVARRCTIDTVQARLAYSPIFNEDGSA